MSSEVAVEMQGGKWKRYPTYKDSGVEWIGEVPEEWEVKRVKSFTAMHKQGYYTEQAYIDEGAKLARITDIDDFGSVFFKNMPFVAISPNDERSFELKDGDFLFARSGTIGRFGLVRNPERSVFASYLILFRFKGVEKEFLRYAFGSHFFKEGLISTLHGGANQNVHAENIKEQYFAVPPFPEQRAIAAFLDRETGRIDTLIEKKGQQIELLQEKRAALISHTVTKGLDPNVKMKDSGVEWLGEVPNEWSSTAVKHHFDIQLGKMLQNKPDSDELLVPYAKALHVLWGKVETNVLPEMWANTFEIQQYGIKEGDLLVCEGGEVGRAGIVESPPKQCIIQNALHRVRAKNSSDLRYLLYVLHAVNSSTWFDVLCNKATIAHFTREKFSDLIIPIPPLSEQRTIAAFLDRETGRIDTLTINIRESLSKLHEYRTALISAAVTGKIDLREDLVS